MNIEFMADDDALAAEVKAAFSNFDAEIAVANDRLQIARVRVMAAIANAEAAGMCIRKHIYAPCLEPDPKSQSEPFLRDLPDPIITRTIEL